MSASRRIRISTGWLLALLLVLAALLLICVWLLGTEAVASASGPRFATQVLTTLASASVALLLGALVLVRRERTERRRAQRALEEKAAELQMQTESAVALARDVETARAQLQKVNEVLERRIQERTADLKVSNTALNEEKMERERAGLSLRETEGNLLIAHDEVEKTLAVHTEELERSNQELEQFAYVASHDLQEPLRAISGCVQILEKRYAAQLDLRGHELIAHTIEGVGRLRELIEGLLAFARVSHLGNEAELLRLGPATTEPVSSGAALGAALKQLRLAIEETGAVVVAQTEMPMVCADHGQLVQLLQNLIGNAIKYRNTAAPRIDISAVRKEAAWVFAIRDNGIGIEPQYFERIFSIFQRLHTRDEYPGAGIGLAICKRIVTQAGGSIWVESKLGKGSTFYFTLPAS